MAPSPPPNLIRALRYTGEPLVDAPCRRPQRRHSIGAPLRKTFTVALLACATAALARRLTGARQNSDHASGHDDSVEPGRIPGTANDICVAKGARLQAAD